VKKGFVTLKGRGARSGEFFSSSGRKVEGTKISPKIPIIWENFAHFPRAERSAGSGNGEQK
jgi:hypothetical protein